MAGRFDHPLIQSWCGNVRFFKYSDVDSSKPDHTNKANYLNVTENNKGNDNYPQSDGLNSKEILRPDCLSSSPSSYYNFFQTNPFSNQYSSNNNSNEVLLPPDSNPTANAKCNTVKNNSASTSCIDTADNSIASVRTYSTAGGGSSDLDRSIGFYLQQFSSASDFLGATFTDSNTNNCNSTSIFNNLGGLNQSFSLDKESFKDCISNTINESTPSCSSQTDNPEEFADKYHSSNDNNLKPKLCNNSSISDSLRDNTNKWNPYNTKNSHNNQELNDLSCQASSKMSGGPPHHSHSRQAPSPNTAWNHLQVPNFYPRQPQHAHMSNEHPLLHQSTWHTPTTEPVKSVSHSHLFSLEQMITERPYQRHSPGVDLSLQRNGSQNGELPTTPISLSVRDANKINSLPPSAIDIQAVELTKSLSPSLKSSSPGLKSGSPGLKSVSPVLKSALPVSPSMKAPISPSISTSPGLHDKQDSPKGIKRLPSKRVDSIIERLNPNVDKTDRHIESSVITSEKSDQDKQKQLEEKLGLNSVIIQPLVTTTSSHDENSTSSSTLNTSTPTNTRDEDVISPFSNNEDSMDSSKSRRKRKPSKTIRVSKETEKIPETSLQCQQIQEITEVPSGNEGAEKGDAEVKPAEDVQKERPRSGSAPPGSPAPITKARRKTSSECETIANITAMVNETISNRPPEETNCLSETCESQIGENSSKSISVSVIKNKREHDVVVGVKSSDDNLNVHTSILVTPAQKKARGSLMETSSFVEVENKLEEMFAGISDDVVEPPKIEKMPLDFNDDSKSLGLEEGNKNYDDSLLKLGEGGPSSSSAQLNDSVTSTSGDLNASSQSLQKRGRPKGSKSRRSSESTSTEISPKRKKANKKSKQSTEGSPSKSKSNSKKNKGKNSLLNKQLLSKSDLKDVYAYDSGSNASSNKSKGPFIQIRGSRESPISVNIVNTPINDDDADRRSNKSKKYHDDTEYRHKVKSRGLHCSTLSNKYDAQTRDATWICVFCKRGPHATDPNVAGPSKYNTSNVSIPLPGDLFGPYIITTDSPEYQRRLDDPYDQQFRSKKVARALGAVANNNKSVSKKSKRKYSESYDSRSSLEGTDSSDVYLGITETKDGVYEVWAHEDCIVWSPGVYLVGPKIVGLEEAVWTSCNVVCSKCRYRGANVCCTKRGCIDVVHVGCATTSDWHLDEENYRALCALHKAP